MSDESNNLAPVVLHYIGDGAFIFGVPARDLTQADIDTCGLTAAQLLEYSPAIYEPVAEA